MDGTDIGIPKKLQVEMGSVLLESWRKGNPCYKVANNLAELCLCPSILWKVELVSSETEHLAEEISKQNVEGVACFLLTTYSKMREERNDLKIELSIQKGAELKNLENSSISISLLSMTGSLLGSFGGVRTPLS